MNQLTLPQGQKKHTSHMVELRGIGHLPRDLLIEILSRLPPKHLCKLKSVSKSWNALLSRDIHFISRHMELSKQHPLLLVRRYISDATSEPNKSTITIELTSTDMQGDIKDKFKKKIDGPVHTFISSGPLSLLCCMYSLYVCNPTLRHLIRVPTPSDTRIHNVGFGYLPKSNEYKIVHMYQNSSVQNGLIKCEIFSFNITEGVSSGLWKRISDCSLSAWTDEYPVCVDGTIYWAISSGWKEKMILCLDLEKEEFSTISYPKHESRKYSLLAYVGLMGTLSVVGFSGEESSMDIWMMKDKRRKIWTMEYSVNLFPLCPKFLIPSDDQSEEILVHMEDKDVVCYNLRSRSLRKIEYCRAMKTYNKPCLYHSSLIPLHSTGS